MTAVVPIRKTFPYESREEMQDFILAAALRNPDVRGKDDMLALLADCRAWLASMSAEDDLLFFSRPMRERERGANNLLGASS